MSKKNKNKGAGGDRSGALESRFKRSVSQARSRGIDTRNTAQKLADQRKKLADQQEQFRNIQGDDRSQGAQKLALGIRNQALQANIDRNQFLLDQQQRRADILSGRITPKRSDFTGFEGGIFGIRAGDFRDTGLPKIREGLTSAEYADFMRDLTDARPELVEDFFPIASGKAARLAFTPAPFKLLAGMAQEGGSTLLEGIKRLAQDKGIIPTDTISVDTQTTATKPEFRGSGNPYADTIQRIVSLQQPETGIKTIQEPETGIKTLQADIPFDEFNRRNRLESEAKDRRLDQLMSNFNFSSTPENNIDVMQSFPKVLTYPFRTSEGEGEIRSPQAPGDFDGIDEARAIFGLPGTEGFSPNVVVTPPVLPFTFPNLEPPSFNEGGLASINNPEYNMLMKASNFDV